MVANGVIRLDEEAAQRTLMMIIRLPDADGSMKARNVFRNAYLPVPPYRMNFVLYNRPVDARSNF